MTMNLINGLKREHISGGFGDSAAVYGKHSWRQIFDQSMGCII
jgi:hypothetical protein